MRVLYYDCKSGISGDMNLGALIDLGVDPEYLENELGKLKISDEFELEIKKGAKKGITGTKVNVVLNHTHDHTHKEADHHHHHRTFNTIRDIIESSDLSFSIKNKSLDMFYEVAKAEGKVHGQPINEVHFHEVGAVDSIVDIVGAAICLEYLEVDEVLSSSIELGGGYVTCAHGKIPVPAPATVEVLKGIPVKTGLVASETTTPTGAAILKATVSEYTDQKALIIDKVGYGLGTKDFKVPNVLRVYLGRMDKTATKKSQQLMIETNIDDMNNELYEYIEEELFKHDALDVYKTPIIMKKGRPAVKLSVLTEMQNKDKIEEILFKLTTTAGVRSYTVDKVMLKRAFETIHTKYGSISLKKFYYNGELIKSKPEYRECVELAKENNCSIQKIYAAIEEGESDEE